MRYRFADFVFDDERGLEGPSGLVPLRPLDSKVLRLLLEAQGRVVSRDAILESVWKGKIVSDDSITQAVRRLRGAMAGADGTDLIHTVYGTGVRISAPIERSAAPADGSAAVAQSVARNIKVAAILTSAREMAAQRSAEDFSAAIEATRNAIDILPTCVDAWITLALLRMFQAGRLLVPPREAGATAIKAANRALELDPSCAEALAVRGWVTALIDRDVAAGLADFDASLQLSGEHWIVRALHAWALVAAGRTEDAARAMQSCMDLNPWGGWSAGQLGWFRLLAGQPDAAIEDVRASLARHPGIDSAHMYCSMVSSALDLHDEAIECSRRAVDLSTGTPMMRAAFASALARGGRRSEALAVIRGLDSTELPVPGTWLAVAHAALGRKDLAIRALERAAAVGEPQFAFAFVDPRLAALRGVPAFERLRHVPGAPG
jgi:DNA-binding winged helix-turn-helix (wHTH) protein/Flp pilus assembly protein TadD